MLQPKSWGKDHYGAALLIVLGMAVLAVGWGYRTGSLNRMGAGFIPVVLGVLLVVIGLAIGLTAAPVGRDAGAPSSGSLVPPLPGDGGHGAPEWRGWGCILGGVLAFVLLGRYGGLVPATFASVFIAALGDRNNTYRGAAALGAVLSVFCVIVFHYGLNLQLPLFQWG
jgi:Tripartite tricarboxylate transporter TctB family